MPLANGIAQRPCATSLGGIGDRLAAEKLRSNQMNERPKVGTEEGRSNVHKWVNPA